MLSVILILLLCLCPIILISCYVLFYTCSLDIPAPMFQNTISVRLVNGGSDIFGTSLMEVLPLSRHKVSLQRAFERTALITSVGFALAASSAVSLAVATSLFGSSDAKSMTKLKIAAYVLSAAAATYGLGFTSSIVAMLMPISQLEQILPGQLVLALPMTAVCCFIFMAPFWSIQLATLLLVRGMAEIFLESSIGDISATGMVMVVPSAFVLIYFFTIL